MWSIDACALSPPHYSLPQAQRFLKCRYDFLQREATRCPRPGVVLALSSCCQKLGRYREGVEYCQLELRGLLKDSQTSLKVLSNEEKMLSHEERETGSPDIKKVQLLLHVLLRQVDMEERRQCMAKGCVQNSMGTLMPTPIQVHAHKIGLMSRLFVNPQQVERRCFDGFSCEEFYTRYASTHTPVIITGLVDHITSVPWTFDYIKKVITCISDLVVLSMIMQDTVMQCGNSVLEYLHYIYDVHI